MIDEMKIKTIFIMILTAAWGSGHLLPAADFRPGSEPDGFRGIAWGTPLSRLPGFELVRYEDLAGGVEVQVYTRPGDDLTWDGVPLTAIEYYFYRGRFYRAGLFVNGGDAWNRFRAALFRRYGAGALQPPEDGREIWAWRGKETTMTLQSPRGEEDGCLTLQSRTARLRIERALERALAGRSPTAAERFHR